MGSPGPVPVSRRAGHRGSGWQAGIARAAKAARTISGGRWAVGRWSGAVGGSLGGRSGREGRPLAGPRASGVTGARRAPGAVGGKERGSVECP